MKQEKGVIDTEGEESMLSQYSECLTENEGVRQGGSKDSTGERRWGEGRESEAGPEDLVSLSKEFRPYPKINVESLKGVKPRNIII